MSAPEYRLTEQCLLECWQLCGLSRDNGPSSQALARKPAMPKIAPSKPQQPAPVATDVTGTSTQGSKGIFGKPYGSKEAASRSEWRMRHSLLPFLRVVVGREAARLWATYLDRKPGDSLEPVRFDESSELAKEFAKNPASKRAHREVVNAIVSAFKKDPTGFVRRFDLNAEDDTKVPLEALLSPEQLKRISSKMVYTSPFDAPGNLAGSLSGSDAGTDQRLISGHVYLRLLGDWDSPDRKGVQIFPKVNYVVRDCVDLLPGDPGAPLERLATIPLSRLEASGAAHDVPFEVRFEGESVDLACYLPTHPPLREQLGKALKRLTGKS